MAYEVLLGETNRRAKVRNPWAVFGLTLITFGIYACFWWYFINRELGRFGRSKGTDLLEVNPALSAIAFTLGYLVLPGMFGLISDAAIAPVVLWIPMIWTVVTTTKRLQQAQKMAGIEDPLSGWVASAAWILTFTLAGPPYTQWHLNQVWEGEPRLVPRETTLPAGHTDLDRLERLAALRKSGALTEAEFATEKARIMTPPKTQGSGAVDRFPAREETNAPHQSNEDQA